MKVIALSPLVFICSCIVLIEWVESSASVGETRGGGKHRRGLAPSNGSHAPQDDGTFSMDQGTDGRHRHSAIGSSEEASGALQVQETEKVLAAWASIESYSGELINRLVRTSLKPILEQLFERTQVSIACQSAIRTVLADASRMQKYALQNSSGRFPPSGLLEGTLTDLGHFDECVSVDQVRVSDDNPVTTRIQGQYCSLILKPPLPTRPRFHTLCNPISSLETLSTPSNVFRWLGENAHSFYYSPIRIGACVPSQCTANDVNGLISRAASSFNLTGSLLNMQCEQQSAEQRQSIYPIQLFCILMMMLLLLVVAAASLVDITGIGVKSNKLSSESLQSKRHESNSTKIPLHSVPSPTGRSVHPSAEGKVKNVSKEALMVTHGDNSSATSCSQWMRFLLCFSFTRNARAILSLETSPRGQDTGAKRDTLPVIHGLRVVTMAWIILGHTYGLVNPHVHSQVFSARFMYTNFAYQGLLNATLSVDTFFFISGLLTMYVFWRKMTRLPASSEGHGFGLFPALSWTLIRYVRLTPPYALAIAIAFVFPLSSSGPLWRETTQPIVDACYTSWWTNLLYINNFYMTDRLCLMHSWYLSNDMQMHIFALIVIYLLLKSRAVALLVLAATIIGCTVHSAMETFINEYPPTIVSTSPVVDDRWKYITDFYYKPWPHLPSYCIGFISGYVLATGSSSRLTSGQRTTTCIFVTFVSFVVLYGVYPWNLGWSISPAITAMYSSTFRTVWTASCAWMTLSLSTVNKDSLLAKCLSWKGLLPLSRVTYMAFLVHPFVIWYHSASRRERFTASHFNYSHLFLGHYILTYLISFFLGACLESPCIAVIKLLTEPSVASDEQVTSTPRNARKDKKKASHQSSRSSIFLATKQTMPVATCDAPKGPHIAATVFAFATHPHSPHPPDRVTMSGIPSFALDGGKSSTSSKPPLPLRPSDSDEPCPRPMKTVQQDEPAGYYTHHLTSRFHLHRGQSDEMINRM